MWGYERPIQDNFAPLFPEDEVLSKNLASQQVASEEDATKLAAFRADARYVEGGKSILKGPMGFTSNVKLATFTAGFILILITLTIALNLINSRSGRAIMALRDNRIAAESVGIGATKFKLTALSPPLCWPAPPAPSTP